MPRPSQRSRSVRRVYKKLPGGRLTVHYKRRKPAKATCSACGKPLTGIPRERPKKMQKLAKTKKRPSRPYAGSLCSSCMRKTIIAQVRAKVV